MKILRNTFFLIIAVVIALYAGFFVFLKVNGRELLTQQLTNTLKREVTIADVYPAFPLGVVLNDLKIDGIAPAKTITAQMSLPGFFRREVNLSYLGLVNPMVNVERTADGKFILSDWPPVKKKSQANTPQPATAPQQPTQEASAKKPGFKIGRLDIRNGRVSFVDRFSGKHFQVALDNFELDAKEITFPVTAANTQFDMTASIVKMGLPFAGSKIKSEGWINLSKKNMDASITIVKPDREVGFHADLTAEDNNMRVKGKLNISSLASEVKPPSQGGESSFEDMLLGALQSVDLRIVTNFDFLTKMDAFEINQVSFQGNVVAPERKSDGPTKAPVETLKDIGKQFEDFGKQFYKENIE